MAVWYCGTVQHAAIAQYANLTAYSVGNIVRQLAAPTVNNERAFRCTTAGTSGVAEPSWTLTKGGTTSTGTAVFTEVTGNSTYGWAAAGKRLRLFASTNQAWAAAGDTVYIASDSSESGGTFNVNLVGTSSAYLYVVSVNPAGSVPPVSADILAGAVVSSASTIGMANWTYFNGITFAVTGAVQLGVNDGPDSVMILENCKLRQANASTQKIVLGVAARANLNNQITLKNTTVEFGDAGSYISAAGGLITWLNTPSAIVSGTLPTALFAGDTLESCATIILDGVDLSALGSGKTIVAASPSQNSYAIRNCKLGASVTVAATPSLPPNRVTLEISDSGATGYRQEIYDYAGTLTTETTIIETGGASDGVQGISWKVVSTANAKQVYPFAAFQIAQWNTATGSSKTATIEIVNDGTTLKNTEVWAEIEYLGSSATPLASLATSGTDILSAGSNITTSTATWTTTGLGSPVKQKITVTFTPQMVGYVRATVYVGKASQTLYIDPKMTIA